MTNITFAVPEELHIIMRKHKEIKWSEVARSALWNQAKKVELMEKILSKSKLTEEDALKIGRKINKGIARKHGFDK